jgi:5-methylcytosine-specific restriction protein A
MMRQSIFLNGVYESVLEEIITAQENNPDKIFFLQPYSSKRIKLLVKNTPSENNRIPLYLSTTTNLDNICYMADIVGWENKQELSPERLAKLNRHIEEYQPSEIEIYGITGNGKKYINLISIINLKKLANQFSVENLVKVNDGKPLRPRTRAGDWAYVNELPLWVKVDKTAIKEQLDEELKKGIEESTSLDDNARKSRLATAPKKPEQIQVVSQVFRRNPDVIVEVLKRANGKCEHCGADAPFLRAKDGSPYLEIHHWKPLADDGEDTVENAGALCPNCHRELHYGLKSG